MEEILDICDEYGKPTGATVNRDEAHRCGILHRTAHVWVVREKNGKTELLLQKRAMEKESFPGCYDTSSAGHIHAGDEPLVSAQRELEEELGIHAEPSELRFIGIYRNSYQLIFHGSLFHDEEVVFVHVFEGKNVDIQSLALQTEEVESVKWFTLEETYQACLDKDPAFCVPEGGLELLKTYLEKKKTMDTYTTNKSCNDLNERFTFRDICPDEAEQAADIEQICFPPNEACSRQMMYERVKTAPECFLVAIDNKAGKIAGFLNGLATDEHIFRDEFFVDATLHQKDGENVMICGLDVLPVYRRQGLARKLVETYAERQRAYGRKRLVLTCLEEKVDMYKSMSFRDLGICASEWGGEQWHEMDRCLDKGENEE